MRPELFEIPFTSLTVKGPGLMIAIGFIVAVYILKLLCRRVSVNHETLVNTALLSLVVGLFGARLLHVIHYHEHFNSVLDVFKIWEPGRELLGGVIAAIIAIVISLRIKKQNILIGLDLLAIVLMAGIGFGRIGCMLEGCCYGKTCDLQWAVEFPYDSIPYNSQAYPDPDRNRPEPLLELPPQYYGIATDNGQWIPAPKGNERFNYRLKPFEMLTDDEKHAVSHDGPYHCKPIHPTQLYSSGLAFIWLALLYLFWRTLGYGSLYAQNKDNVSTLRLRLAKPGMTAFLMLVIYGFGRILLESLRADNPYEVSHLTISQIISIALITVGIAIMAIIAATPIKR